MRTKLIQLGIVLAAGILAGSMVANMSALADDDDEEESELPVSIVYKVIEDGECTTDQDIGTIGWCPDGGRSSFLVEVSGLTEESIVIGRVVAGGSASEGIFANTIIANTWVDVLGTERDLVRLSLGVSPADGTDLRLTIINPPED